MRFISLTSFKKFTYIFMIMILLQNLFIPTLVTAESDGTPPVVESVEISPNEVG
ncbi:hypothetical protein CV093_17735 [Oceanobacillus sp. 143]|nr:hypothetical protein CV093_17735 [Oceanobacillus sp. 143]